MNIKSDHVGVPRPPSNPSYLTLEIHRLYLQRIDLTQLARGFLKGQVRRWIWFIDELCRAENRIEYPLAFNTWFFKRGEKIGFSATWAPNGRIKSFLDERIRGEGYKNSVRHKAVYEAWSASRFSICEQLWDLGHVVNDDEAVTGDERRRFNIQIFAASIFHPFQYELSVKETPRYWNKVIS